MIEEKNEGPDMNKLQAEIEKLEASAERGELDELLLNLMHERANELGEDPSDEEAEEALNQARTEFILHLLRSNRAKDVANHEWDEDTRST